MLCRRCKIDKKESDFYFDKRRNKVRTPCKKCSNLTKKEKALKDDWTKDFKKVKKHLSVKHKIKNPSDIFVYYYIEHLKLKRELKKSKEYKLIVKENIIVCEKCLKPHEIPQDIPLDDLISLQKIIKERHKVCKN